MICSTEERIAEDARWLLRDWPAEAIKDVWHGLRAAIAAFQLEHGGSPTLDTADWVEALDGYAPLDDLLDDVARIESMARQRRSKAPMPRLLAVIALRSIEAGDLMTALNVAGVVHQSAEQSRRRYGAQVNDVVTRMATDYLRSQPAASNRQIFEFLHDFHGVSEAFADYAESDDALEYLPHRKAIEFKLVDYRQFQWRMHYVRRRLGMPAKGTPSRCFSS